MAVISTGLLTKGLRSEFFNRLAMLQTYFADLTTRIPSNANLETYKWLGSVPMAREFGNGRLAQGLRTESYTVENLKYEATIEVDRDELSDDQTGQIAVRIRELADRFGSHKDYMCGQLLESGGTAGYVAYDGLTFFNDAHVSGDSGNQDNDLTFNVTTPSDPTTAEFKDSFKQAVGAMLKFKDDRGYPMIPSQSGLACVVPPNMLFAAQEAMSATIINNTSNVIAGIARVISLPWLTSSDKWYLLKTDGVVRPLIFQDREPIEFTALDNPNDDEAFKREKFLYGVRARYRLTYGYWQYAVRTTLN